MDVSPHPSDPSRIHTYHCICTNLLLATIYSLVELERRGGSSLDKAYILPCPSADGPVSEVEADIVSGRSKAAPTCTLFTSLSIPPRQAPVMVRREDGYEKRWLLRCGRCRLIVGYQLDWAQYSSDNNAEPRNRGRRDDVAYILPGAVITTEAMVEGKTPPEENWGCSLPAS